MDAVYKRIAREGTADDVENIRANRHNIDYHQMALLKKADRNETTIGYVIKIGDKIDYLYFESSLDKIVTSILEFVDNKKSPTTITIQYGGLTSYIEIIEVKDDYLIIFMEHSIYGVYRGSKFFDEVLFRYNLILLNGQDL